MLECAGMDALPRITGGLRKGPTGEAPERKGKEQVRDERGRYQLDADGDSRNSPSKGREEAKEHDKPEYAAKSEGG